MKSAAEIKQMLRQWVLDQARAPVQVDDDTQILEQRLIKSVQIMDLILYLEYLRGAPVEIEQLAPGAFASVNAIYERFFVAEGADHV